MNYDIRALRQYGLFSRNGQDMQIEGLICAILSYFCLECNTQRKQDEIWICKAQFPFFSAGRLRDIKNKSFASKWCHKYLMLVEYYEPFLRIPFINIDPRTTAT